MEHPVGCLCITTAQPKNPRFDPALVVTSSATAASQRELGLNIPQLVSVDFQLSKLGWIKVTPTIHRYTVEHTWSVVASRLQWISICTYSISRVHAMEIPNFLVTCFLAVRRLSAKGQRSKRPGQPCDRIPSVTLIRSAWDLITLVLSYSNLPVSLLWIMIQSKPTSEHPANQR